MLNCRNIRGPQVLASGYAYRLQNYNKKWKCQLVFKNV